MRVSSSAVSSFVFRALALVLASSILIAAPFNRVSALSDPLEAHAVPSSMEEDASSTDLRFVRLSKDDKGEPLSLDTAIITLELPNGGSGDPVSDEAPVQVALVSAVHIGESAYYSALNEKFRSYDAVLFELVAEANVQQREDIKSGGDHPVSVLQKGLQNLLKLDFQLTAIDYKAPNMVHADMTPAQLSKSMAARNESLGSLLLRATAAGMARDARGGGKPPDLSSLFLLIFDDTRAMGLRRILASEFSGMDELLETLNGPEGSAILTDRNAVALSKMSEAIEGGKRKIAIFYGGAHMPDLLQRIQTSYGARPVSTEWLTAWRLQ